LDAPVTLEDSVGTPDIRGPRKSDAASVLDPVASERAKRLKSQLGGEADQRTVLLGLILASLREVPISDAAAMLDLREERLIKMIHGEEAIPAKFSRRWLQVAEVLRLLAKTLQPDATARWLHTAVPAFEQRTPIQMMERGKTDAVLSIVRSYLDPSFT
jgi:hypothetical protein